MALVIKAKPQKAEKYVALDVVVVAFDISTKTGVVSMTPEGATTVVEEWEGEAIVKGERTARKRVDRAIQLGERAHDLIMQWKPKLVVVEGYATHGKFINYVQFELGAVVRFAAHDAGVPFIEVSPTTLKKFVVGTAGSVKNKVGKDKVRLGVYKKWDFEHDSDNVIDAYGLARFGLCVLGHAEATKDQAEVIKKLRGEL